MIFCHITLTLTSKNNTTTMSPEGETALLVISNLALIPSIVQAGKQHRWDVSAQLMLIMIVSMMQHICFGSGLCMSAKPDVWNRMDHAYAYFAMPLVGLIYIGGQARAVLTPIAHFECIMFVLNQDPSSWFIPVAIGCQTIVALGVSLPLFIKQVKCKWLLSGVLMLSFGIFCKAMGDINHYAYWHSAWHVAVFLGAWMCMRGSPSAESSLSSSSNDGDSCCVNTQFSVLPIQTQKQASSDSTPPPPLTTLLTTSSSSSTN